MGEALLCFVSLRGDLPTVWHGLERWGFGGNEQMTFSLYINVCSVHFAIFNFLGVWRLHCGPILGVLHHSAGAWHLGIIAVGPDAMQEGNGCTSYKSR